MKIIFIAISMLMTFSAAFANTLTGHCTITKTGSEPELFSFNLAASKEGIASKKYSVKVPLKKTFNDDYIITVINTAGISDTWSPNEIQIAVTPIRYFCNPPVMQEDGTVSRTKCDRPKGWRIIAGADTIRFPKTGDTLTFQDSTEQISFSCEAILN